MWQHHFEFLLLGYGAYMTFAELCKANLPDIPDQHIAQMVAGHRRARSSSPTPSCAGSRALRSSKGSTARSSRAARRRRSTPSWRRATPAARGSRSSRASRIRGSTWRRATASTTPTASWLDDPRIPYASLIGHIGALQAGEDIERPTDHIAARARPPRDRVRRPARRRRAQGVRRAARALAHRLPVRRGAQVLLRLLVPDELVEQDPRVRRPARRARLPRRTAKTIFQLSRLEVHSALDELLLTWATGGRPRGPKYWPPIVARRESCSSSSPSGRRRPPSARCPRRFSTRR